MYTTYKLMFNCTNTTYLDKSLEDLCEEYNNTLNVDKRNKIVAAMFCKVYPMILTIQKKYYSITNEQKVEHALFHLVRSIKYYKNDGKVKFSSFFHTHMENQMKTLLTSENSLKKAVFQNIVRNNDNVLNWYVKNEPTKNIEMSDEYFLDNLENSTYLSTEEKDYCKCVLQGFDRTKQISKELNLTQKYNITDPINENMSVEKQHQIQEQRDQRRIRKIKQSIKDKLDKYGRQIFG